MRPTQILRGGGGGAPIGKHDKLVAPCHCWHPQCAFSRVPKRPFVGAPRCQFLMDCCANHSIATSATGETLVSDPRSELPPVGTIGWTSNRGGIRMGGEGDGQQAVARRIAGTSV